MVEKRIKEFTLVRDIPYMFSDSSIDHSLKGFGCTDKSEILFHRFAELGYQARYATVEFCWKDLFEQPNIPHAHRLVEFSQDLVDSIHTYVQIKVDNRWITLDPTWDSSLKDSGLPVNLDWDGLSDTLVAVNPLSVPKYFAALADLKSYKSDRYKDFSVNHNAFLYTKKLYKFEREFLAWLNQVRSNALE